MDNSGVSNGIGLLEASGFKQAEVDKEKLDESYLLLHRGAVLERRESLRSFLEEFGIDSSECDDQYRKSDLDKIGTKKARLKLKPGHNPVIEYSH